jgi:glycosyltransferase involved in cell wall biosynthesis
MELDAVTATYTQKTRLAFVAGLKKLLANPQLRHRFAEQGQAYVLQNYVQEKVLARWEDLFEALNIKASANSTPATTLDQKPLTVLHLISGLGHGGAESVLFRLVSHAQKDKHIVLSMTDEGVFGDKLREVGVELHCLNMPSGKMRFSDFIRLGKKLKQLAPDVVQCWMYHADFIGGLVARLAGIKGVVWGIRNSGDNLARSSRSSYVLARYFGWSSRLIPRRIVVCAELAAKRHQAWGYQASKMRVIPNGYDLSRWQAVDAQTKKLGRERLGLSDNEELIGFVARWNPLKDHANLIQAFAQLLKQRPATKLLLIGEGLEEHNAALKSLLADNNLKIGQQVILLGRRDDVPELMPLLDLHVLSSMAEGFPNVVAEAMACGVPNVVTDVGDAAFIVGDYGWVVPAQNSDALADAIATALDFLSTEQAVDFKLQCRQRVLDNFSLDKMVHAYERVWREALEK